MSKNNEWQIFNNSDVDFLIKQLEEATAEEAEKEIAVTWSMLKTSAKNFIKSYEILEAQGEQLSAKLLRSAMTPLTGLRGQHSAYIVRSKYLLAFKFDKDLTTFLQNAPKSALYVLEDEQGELHTFEMPISELARRITGRERINITIAQLTANERKSIEEANKEDEKWQKHVSQASAAYQGTINRLSHYYAAVGRTGNKEKGGLLMYQIYERRWTIARVLNKGDLKEAYASAIMTQHQEKTLNSDPLCAIDKGAPPEYSEQLIAAFHKNYIIKVTNQAAIVSEDVVTKNKQYAVKSAASDAPGLLQYLNIANWIAKQTTGQTKEIVQNYIKKQYPQDAARNTILQAGLKKGKKIVDDLKLDKLEKNYIHNIMSNGW